MPPYDFRGMVCVAYRLQARILVDFKRKGLLADNPYDIPHTTRSYECLCWRLLPKQGSNRKRRLPGRPIQGSTQAGGSQKAKKHKPTLVHARGQLQRAKRRRERRSAREQACRGRGGCVMLSHGRPGPQKRAQ